MLSNSSIFYMSMKTYLSNLNAMQYTILLCTFSYYRIDDHTTDDLISLTGVF